MRRALAVAVIVACRACKPTPSVAGDDWPLTGGDPGNSRYSSLDQINRENVSQLRVAWTYHTGDAPPGARTEIQATPIVVDDVLYTTTPALALVALRADSGTLIWRFDPFANRHRASHVNRGVAYWGNGSERRIFFSAGRRLYAVEALTGRPITTFGDSGWVDLAAGLGREVGDAFLVATSPGIVYEDLLIQGTRVGEGEGSAPGHVRAYDVRTGEIRWIFHTIPRPGELGHDTWPADAWRTAGGANSWAGMSVDVETRHRLRPDRLRDARFLRWRAHWRQPVRQHPAGARCAHRRAALALPDGAPRPVGPRSPRNAKPADR